MVIINTGGRAPESSSEQPVFEPARAPMANWYPTQNFRLELAYGFGQLDRYAFTGNASIFQAWIQLAVL